MNKKTFEKICNKILNIEPKYSRIINFASRGISGTKENIKAFDLGYEHALEALRKTQLDIIRKYKLINNK